MAQTKVENKLTEIALDEVKESENFLTEYLECKYINVKSLGCAEVHLENALKVVRLLREMSE